MFNTATPYQGSIPVFQEAYVAGVDIKRRECRCRLDSGQTVTAVRWLGDQVPSEQDTVLLVKLPNGSFIILDKIAIPTRSPNPLPGLGTGEPEELANFSTLQMENSTNALMPADIRPGDKVLASDGGGLIAALRGGSVVLKAGGLSQLLLSPFDSLGRLVTQNWEHHTGVDSVYKVNMGGKTYVKTELFDSPGAAAGGQPSQVILEGDVAAAGGPGGFRVRQTLDDGGVIVQTVTENRDGSTHQNIQTGGSSVDIKSGIDGYSVQVNGGVGSSIVLGEDSAKVHCGGSEVTLTDSGIELKIGGSVCKLTDSEFKVTTTTFTVDAAEYNFA